MPEEKEPEQLVQRLYEQISTHLETRWAYFSLVSTEKLSVVAARLAGMLTLAVFGLLVLFFFSLGFAWWLGDCIGHRAGGFALAGLVFVPIAYGVFRWIGPFVQDQILDTLMDEPENTEENG